VTTKPPLFLRLRRLLAALVLLGLAWVGIIGVIQLGFMLVNILSAHTHPVAQLALAVLDGLGVFWLALMSAACILVGAFALRLGLTRGDW